MDLRQCRAALRGKPVPIAGDGVVSHHPMGRRNPGHAFHDIEDAADQRGVFAQPERFRHRNTGRMRRLDDVEFLRAAQALGEARRRITDVL